jgi:hypothetical protein
MFDESRSDGAAIDRELEVSITKVSWQEADRALRRIAARRAGLDAEEARWLLIARAAEAHLAQGFSTFQEYVERVLGYGPHAFAERMRVAEALQRLPETAEALARGRIHHLRQRARGGGHHPSNLAVLCSGHHGALHDGRLVITGDAPRLTFQHADGRPWGTPPPDPLPDQVRAALCRLGFKPAEAEHAVRTAASHVGPDDPIEAWFGAALRASPRPPP